MSEHILDALESEGDQLPEELMAELKKPRKYQKEVIDILKAAGKPLSTNEILIKLYEKFDIMAKRQNLKTQLWHLSEAGIIESKRYGDAYSLPSTQKGKSHE